MEKEQLKALQDELDVLKWNDTQARGGKDTCGTYDYCVKCDKSVEFPCAQAKTAFETKPVETVAEEKPVKKAKPASDKAVRTRKTTKSKKAE